MASIDLGSAILEFNLRIPGLEPPTFTWKFGAPEETSPADRVPGARPAYNSPPTGVDWEMDLQDDKKVLARIVASSEMGNPANFAGTYTWQTDRPDVVAIADQGDGSAWLAATGVTGPAVITVTATRDSDSQVFTGTGLLNVVGGDAETFAVEFDEDSVTEVTPDDTTPAPL